MLDPGYEKLSELGIADTINDRFDIYRALVKYSDSSTREAKIRAGISFMNINYEKVHNLVGGIYLIDKKKGAK